MTIVGTLGAHTIAQWHRVRHLAAVTAAVWLAALRPGTWRAAVRNVLARQILFTGYEATRFMSLIALMVGIAVVVQAQVWLTAAGQSQLLGPVLVAVIVREVGPLLTNFVVIGRSGTAIATELGNMQVHGEVHVLDAQGLDPFIYLVIPRVLGVAVSVFCLTIVFVVMSFVSGYLSGLAFAGTEMSPLQFADTVLAAITPADVFNLVIKTLVPGSLTGVICCTEGLSVGGVTTEVPQAATRGVVRSIAALFITTVIVSVATYL